MHGVRGFFRDVLARGPGLPSDLSPPSPPVFTLPNTTTLTLSVLRPSACRGVAPTGGRGRGPRPKLGGLACRKWIRGTRPLPPRPGIASAVSKECRARPPRLWRAEVPGGPAPSPGTARPSPARTAMAPAKPGTLDAKVGGPAPAGRAGGGPGLTHRPPARPVALLAAVRPASSPSCSACRPGASEPPASAARRAR